MTPPILHRNWAKPYERITDGYSLEITAKDEGALIEAAPMVAAETPVAITFLPGEAVVPRVQAAATVRAFGFEPMPHFSARRIRSEEDFRHYLHAVVKDADVRRCFVVAGDPVVPEGSFADTSALLATGAFEEAGIRAIGIGGHPEGHPHMSKAQCWDVLHTKIADIEGRGMAPLIVTQFSFDADRVLGWLAEARRQGIAAPVRIGVPGPAGVKTLVKFARYCGVGASTAVLRKYGVSLAGLVGKAGPDKLVSQLEAGIGAQHGPVRLHFYPFGGVEKTVEWIRGFASETMRE